LTRPDHCQAQLKAADTSHFLGAASGIVENCDKFRKIVPPLPNADNDLSYHERLVLTHPRLGCLSAE
jgi:hypothetical protein